jgi:hypothetical protein
MLVLLRAADVTRVNVVCSNPPHQRKQTPHRHFGNMHMLLWDRSDIGGKHPLCHNHCMIQHDKSGAAEPETGFPRLLVLLLPRLLVLHFRR